MAKAIVLVGGEGCGKTTVMETLASLEKFFQIEMSDLVAQKRRDDAEFDRAVDEIIVSGQYLPCNEIKPIFLEHMADVSPMSNIVLGGCVRRKLQAQYVLDCLEKMGYEIHIVYLKLLESECKERIEFRANKAKKEGLNVRKRDLDPEAVQLSLNSFFSEINQILEYVETRRFPVHVVYAVLSKEEVFSQLCKKTCIQVQSPVSV